MSEAPNPTPNYSRRRKVVGSAVAGGLLLLGAGTAKFVDDKVDDIRANEAQPYCIVPVEPGDTVNGLVNELAEEGDRGDYGVRVLTPDGRERQTLYAGEEGVPTVDAVQPGDTVEVSNVDPLVCQRVGGAAMNDAARAK